MGVATVYQPVARAHPTPAAERSKVRAQIESLYRLTFDDGGRVLYYVEATKRYGMPPLPADRKTAMETPRGGCSVMTFGNGFFLVEADGVVPAPTLEVRVSSCDYDAVSLMLPLAALDDGLGSPLWIGQVTGWDYESYGGFRWDQERERMADVFFTPGGSCGPSGW
jgi:hypothetical protein